MSSGSAVSPLRRPRYRRPAGPLRPLFLSKWRVFVLPYLEETPIHLTANAFYRYTRQAAANPLLTFRARFPARVFLPFPFPSLSLWKIHSSWKQRSVYKSSLTNVATDKSRFVIKYRLDSPPLRPPVLEPGFHLRVRHLQGLGQRRPFGGRQVLLLVKTLLQLGDLQPREAGPRLLPLRRRPVLIGMADSPRKCSGHYVKKEKKKIAR